MQVDVEGLFVAAGVPIEMLGRVDQTWEAALHGGPREVRQYLKATEVVVDVVVSGMGPSGPRPAGFVEEVLARVAAAPLAEHASGAGYAVARMAVVNAEELLGLPAGTIRGLPVGPAHPRGPAGLGDAGAGAAWLRRSDDLLADIADALGQARLSAVRKIRRVLRPGNETTLARWLGATRPTVRAWEADGVPAGERGHRARAVERIADLLDEHLDPAEVPRYVHDIPLEAMGGRTIAEVLSDRDNAAVEQVRDGLAAALVW